MCKSTFISGRKWINNSPFNGNIYEEYFFNFLWAGGVFEGMFLKTYNLKPLGFLLSNLQQVIQEAEESEREEGGYNKNGKTEDALYAIEK